MKAPRASQRWLCLAWLGCLGLASFAGEPEKPWSFAPVTRPAAPKVQQAAWLRDGLDIFILARIEAAGLTPNPDADRATLLRRATFDLTGLPPTPEEITAFLRDPATDEAALAKVVDRLLASPRFGERWGRHWLDVTRYADSVGRTWNSPFLYAWRYRDWVIDSLNEDKPFPLFAAEQIAGDLLPAKTIAEKRSRILGTGFLTLGALPLQDSTSEAFALDRVDDQIDVTTRAFLGLTVACARCHDHKTDPISQRDYYALAGIFYSTDTFSGGQRGTYVDPNLFLALPTQTQAPNPSLAPSRPRASTAPTMAMMDTMDSINVTSDTISGGAMDEKGLYKNVQERAMGVREGTLQDCELRIKGEWNQRAEAPARGDLQIAGLPRLPAVGPKESGRYALARWVVASNNPLTPRVYVNRVWSHLFGRGLVRTLDDFGLTGEKPTHPELLDHLASRFVTPVGTSEAGFGWSTKKLLRAILLSRTYRLSSASEPQRLAKDSANETYWRMTPRRLELEAIRDAMLMAGGELRFERPGGIPIAGNGGKGKFARTRALLDENSGYRTVYLPILRDLLPEIYKTFDFPEPTQIKGQREVTTVPAQALFFLNSDFAIGAAKSISSRVLSETGLRNDESRVARLWLLLLGREPSRDEASDAKQFLSSDPDAARWAALAQALLAGSEFRYVW